jgi:hypothetical protein
MKANQRSPFLTAFFNPANLAMLGVIAAASLCAAWWLLPIGLALWLVMFLVVFNNPALRFSNMVASREPLARRFQSLFDRVQQAQMSLFSALASGSSKSRRTLQPVQEAVNHIVDQAYQLCQRFSALENRIIVSRTYQNPETELAQIEEKIKSASDPATKQDYEEARKTLDGQVAENKSMATLLDRFDVQLGTLASVLEGVVTTAVRLQTLKNGNLHQEVENVLGKIRDQARQMVEFNADIGGIKKQQ